jgi:hypothetical protein
MSYCSLAEAFTGPAAGAAGAAAKAQKRHKRAKEGFVPAALSGAPDPDRISVPLVPPTSELLHGPPSSATAQPAGDGVKLDDLFPLPGETGESEEWEKAFTLEGSRTPGPASSVLGLQGAASSVLGLQGAASSVLGLQGPAPASSGPASAASSWVRPDGSVPVAGKSTLWRDIPVPTPSVLAPASGSGFSDMSAIPSEITHRLDSLSRQLEALSTPSPMQSTAELFLFVAIGLLILLAVDTLLRFAVTIASKQFGGARGRGSGRGFRFRSRW